MSLDKPSRSDKIARPEGRETNDRMNKPELSGEEPKSSLDRVKSVLKELRDKVDSYKNGDPKRAEKMANNSKFKEIVYNVCMKGVIQTMESFDGIKFTDFEKDTVGMIVKAVLDGKYDLTTGSIIEPKKSKVEAKADKVKEEKPEPEPKPKPEPRVEKKPVTRKAPEKKMFVNGVDNALAELRDKVKEFQLISPDAVGRMAEDPKYKALVYNQLAIGVMNRAGKNLSGGNQEKFKSFVSAVVQNRFDLDTGKFIRPDATPVRVAEKAKVKKPENKRPVSEVKAEAAAPEPNEATLEEAVKSLKHVDQDDINEVLNFIPNAVKLNPRADIYTKRRMALAPLVRQLRTKMTVLVKGILGSEPPKACQFFIRQWSRKKLGDMYDTKLGLMRIKAGATIDISKADKLMFAGAILGKSEA